MRANPLLPQLASTPARPVPFVLLFPLPARVLLVFVDLTRPFPTAQQPLEIDLIVKDGEPCCKKHKNVECKQCFGEGTMKKQISKLTKVRGPASFHPSPF